MARGREQLRLLRRGEMQGGGLICDVGGGQVPRKREGLGGGWMALPGRHLPEVPAPAAISAAPSQEGGVRQCRAGHA